MVDGTLSPVQTVRAIRRYRRGGWLAFAAAPALFMAAGLALMAWQSWAMGWVDDADVVVGEVIDSSQYTKSKWTEVRYEYQSRQFQDTVRLNYESPDEFFDVGAPIEVFVDPTQPSRIALDGESDMPPWIFLPFLAVIMASILLPFVGISVFIRAARMRRLAKDVSWMTLPMRSTYSRAPRRFWTTLGHLNVGLPGWPTELTVRASEGAMMRSGLLETELVNVTGDPNRGVLLHAPGSDQIMLGRPSQVA